MKNLGQGFEIDDRLVFWGTTLSEAKSMLTDYPMLNTYDETRHLHFACNSAYGMPALEFAVSSSALDRPVRQVVFELSDPGYNRMNSKIKFWKEYIGQYLGKPKKTSRHSTFFYPDPSSGVKFCSSWLDQSIRVTLSVYGGERQTNNGIAHAGLFIDWTDEIKAAQPFIKDYEECEVLLDTLFRNLSDCKIYELGSEQKQWHLPDYTLSNPHIALSNPILRKSQKVLSCRNLLDTPADLKDVLNSKSVAIWRNDNEQYWGISNIWDTVFFKMKQDVPIMWHNVLPGKGPGGMILNISDLSIEDEHSSKPLTSIVSEIECIMDATIHCTISEAC